MVVANVAHFLKKTVEFAVPPPYTLYRETRGEGIYTREGIYGKGKRDTHVEETHIERRHKRRSDFTERRIHREGKEDTLKGDNTDGRLHRK